MKNPKAITLVSLIITIIILLILAIVSINLIINGGIIDKADRTVKAYSKAEIEEQIKLTYLECQTEKIYATNLNEEEFMTNSLKKTFGNDNIASVKVKNGKVTVNMTVKGEPKTYIYKSKTGESYEYIDPFDYGEYTKENIPAGKDIQLGSEKFRIFYNQNGVIKAMPWYNITLPNDLENNLPIQSLNAGTTSFSTRPYWSTDENDNVISGWNSNAINKAVDIELNNDLNNLQKYIEAYEKRLETLGAENIKIRAAKKQELETDGITEIMRNPGQTNKYFWLDSGNSDISVSVWAVYTDGNIYAYRYNNSYGVRPIIIIKY